MKLNVAAVQLSSGSDVARNVEAAVGLVNDAADRGAQYVQVPEYFNFLGPFSGFETAAEPVPGDTTRRDGRGRLGSPRDAAPRQPPGALADRGEVLQHQRRDRPERRNHRHLSQGAPLRRQRPRRDRPSRIRGHRPRRGDRRRSARRLRARSLGLLRRALPRVVPKAGPRRGRRDRHPGRLQRRHGARPLGPLGRARARSRTTPSSWRRPSPARPPRASPPTGTRSSSIRGARFWPKRPATARRW